MGELVVATQDIGKLLSDFTVVQIDKPDYAMSTGVILVDGVETKVKRMVIDRSHRVDRGTPSFSTASATTNIRPFSFSNRNSPLPYNRIIEDMEKNYYADEEVVDDWDDKEDRLYDGKDEPDNYDAMRLSEEELNARRENRARQLELARLARRDKVRAMGKVHGDSEHQSARR